MCSILKSILDGSEYNAYSRYICVPNLKSIFVDHLVITHINGKSNVVTFRNTAVAILQDFYNSQQNPDLSSE